MLVTLQDKMFIIMIMIIIMINLKYDSPIMFRRSVMANKDNRNPFG